MGLRRAAFVAAVLVGGVVACQVVAGIEEVPKVEPAPDAAPSPVDDAASPRDPCAHDAPPPPTGKDDAPGRREGRYYLAFRTLSVDVARSDGSPVGFDLDGVCTCDPRPGTHAAGEPTCVAPGTRCDADGGVDNQLRVVLDRVGDVVTGSLDEVVNITDRIRNGFQTVVLYLDGYNGTPNDPDVTVGLFLSNGIEDPSGCSPVEPSGFDDAGPPYRPQWCGSDIWTADPDTLFPGLDASAPRPSRADRGYVTEGRLVFSGESVPTYFGTSQLDIFSPRLSGRLVPGPDGGLRLEDATFAGRLPANAVLEATGRVLTGSPLEVTCADDNVGGQALLALVGSELCGSLDVTAGPGLDRTGAACTAISVGFQLTAETAVVRGVKAVPKPSLAALGCHRAVEAGLLECP